MSTLHPISMPSSPVMKKRQREGIKRCERFCCLTLTYFPLVFVYGLTTWALWVETRIGFLKRRPPWTGLTTSFIGLLLYLLLSWSYTVAVFVDPGSTLSSSSSQSNGYNSLPSQESQPNHPSSLTVKSTGGERFCKKCQARKPDRAHHCSTCRRCVLKMDHHCPWLATCLGLRNYKAFLLFLTYTTLFCWVCFAVTMGWIWSEVLSDGGYNDTLMPVNYLVLAVTSGIFGLVLTGFTGWHYSLAWRNQTTIEKLEKTRYVTGRKITMKQEEQQHRRTNDGGDEGYATRSSTPSYGEQLREIHTNMVPGVTRLEEGEEEEEYEEQNPYHHHQHNHHREFNIHPSSAQSSLQASYAQLERAQERARYETYLDEQDSEKLPHAFDLGWRANLRHLFGDRKWLWFVPVCTTTGDGWHWDPSPKWIAARDDLRRRRDERRRREELGLGWEGHS